MKTTDRLENFKAGIISMTIIILACAVTFTACSLVCCKPAKAGVNGFIEVQIESPDLEHSAQISGGFSFNSQDVPWLGVSAFLISRQGLTKAYAGPTFWVVPNHLKFNFGFGIRQADNGPLAQMSFSTLFLYDSFGFCGIVEWNITKLDQMEGKTWYLLKAWYQPLSWLKVGLIDKRSTGFGPYAEFIVPLGESVKGSIFLHWYAMPAEEAVFNPKNINIGLKFAF